MIVVAIFLFSAFLVGQALADGGGFYIEAKIGASSQRANRDVVVNEPYTSAGGLQLGRGNIPIDSFSNSSLVGGVALGYNFAPRFGYPIRLDLEFLARTYRDINQTLGVNVTVLDTNSGQSVSDDLRIIENSEIGIHTIMANLYYDFLNNSAFTPFVGAGFGLSILHMQINRIELADYYREDNVDAGDVQLAWGLTGGVSYSLNQDWSLSFAYKFTDTLSKSLTSDILEVGLESDVLIHDFLLGLRYSF